MPEIHLYKSAHGTADAVIFDMPKTKLVDWFSLIDVWGSPGYDRFNNGGLYFEIPKEMYDIIPNLPFISKYHIKVTKY